MDTDGRVDEGAGGADVRPEQTLHFMWTKTRRQIQQRHRPEGTGKRKAKGAGENTAITLGPEIIRYSTKPNNVGTERMHLISIHILKLVNTH